LEGTIVSIKIHSHSHGTGVSLVLTAEEEQAEHKNKKLPERNLPALPPTPTPQPTIYPSHPSLHQSVETLAVVALSKR